ncbi:hypothetical protein ACIZ62_18670 [Acetobacterium carbinolicum]|uniref:hypothetical protein n=1 Tax=Acetobacterium carbinolicum TaxID=52690 RepID=UPI0039BEF7A7
MDKILMNNQRIRSQVDMVKTKSRVSMEKMKDCVWIYDFDMKRFLYINASSSQLGGLTADEAMKKKQKPFLLANLWKK